MCERSKPTDPFILANTQYHIQLLSNQTIGINTMKMLLLPPGNTHHAETTLPVHSNLHSKPNVMNSYERMKKTDYGTTVMS